MATPAETLTHTGEHIIPTIEDSIANTIGGDISPLRVRDVLEQSPRLKVAGLGNSPIAQALTSSEPILIDPEAYSWKTGQEIFWHGSPTSLLGTMETPFFGKSYNRNPNGTELILGISSADDPKLTSILHVQVDTQGLSPRQQAQIAERELFELIEKSLDGIAGNTVLSTKISQSGNDTRIVREAYPDKVTIEEKKIEEIVIEVPDNPVEGFYQSNDPAQIERLTSRATSEQREIFDTVINPWAQSLPGEKSTIVDLAAGIGVEAALLAQNHNVVAIDQSEVYVNNNLHTNAILGNVDDLTMFEDASVDGALLKDALLFLIPDVRRKMLQELSRVLRPGGSLLIISQDIPELVVSAISRYHLYPRERRSSDDEKWREEYVKLAKTLNDGEEYEMNNVFSICTPEKVEQLGQEFGFNYELIKKYDATDSLAKENRWVRTEQGGFVSKLTKPIS